MFNGPELPERIWTKLQIDEESGCWLWTAGTDSKGYGRCRYEGKMVSVHRLVYSKYKIKVPSTLMLDHKCRVRNCANPDHLRIVTNKQNCENRKGANVTSASGYRGVYWFAKGKSWMVHVQHNNQRYRGGHFKNIEDANRAAIALRNKLFTHNDEEEPS